MTVPLLRVTRLVKAFPGLLALDEVSLDVNPGEIVAVVGHNGSGKSTLVKVLAGVYTADGGEVVTAEGSELHFIHQDLALIDELSTVENLVLTAGAGGPLVPYPLRVVQERARGLVARFGLAFDVDAPVRELTPAQRAVAAISRALDGWEHPANVLVLDESTESLHRSEVDVLFDAVRRLAAEGAGVIFVSHRLDEVLGLADRVVVLRDGRTVLDASVSEVDQHRLVELISGAAAVAASETPAQVHRTVATPALRVQGLRGGTVDHLDLELHAGETVGIAGVLGSGREAVPALLFGAAGGVAASFDVSGMPYPKRSPRRSLRRRMAFVPGDRARRGAVRDLTARENITLPNLRGLTGPLGAVSMRRERSHVARLLDDYGVRPPRADQRFALFSGGNQQKIVMARALRDEPAVLLLDEPTQGVDIGAKATIYDAVDRAAARGAAVLVSSSDAKELLRLCSRVIVLRAGRAAVELRGAALTEHRLLAEGYGLS
jgi:ribose transport system ATP-binding protein